MLHRLNVEWPILSLDFIRDNLGQQRTKVPRLFAASDCSCKNE
jgi:hypothetical protein